MSDQNKPYFSLGRYLEAMRVLGFDVNFNNNGAQVVFRKNGLPDRVLLYIGSPGLGSSLNQSQRTRAKTVEYRKAVTDMLHETVQRHLAANATSELDINMDAYLWVLKMHMGTTVKLPHNGWSLWRNDNLLDKHTFLESSPKLAAYDMRLKAVTKLHQLMKQSWGGVV